uniref:PH domain-containing protein n=1 Tax=Strigamia maritima TaxID=126957 RepID=T1JA48_STRMM
MKAVNMSMVFMYLMKDWYQTLDDSSRGGSLANSRLTLGSRDTVLASKSSLNLVDASIQVDLTLDIVAYESDDEVMGRKKLRSNKKSTPLYSREDIREQYCITSKEVNAIESSHSRRFFGCIPNQDWKSCNRSLLLPSCVRKSKISSDENLAAEEGSPTVQQVKMTGTSMHDKDGPSGQQIEEMVRDEDYELLRKPRALCTLEKRYTYPESDLSVNRPFRGRPKSDILPVTQAGDIALPMDGTPYHRPTQLNLRSHESPSMCDDVVNAKPLALASIQTELNTVLLRRQQTKTPDMYYEERRQKHVSFDSASLARSQSVAGTSSFDDGHVTSMTCLPSGRRTTSPEKHKSQERLLDIGVRRGPHDVIDRRVASIRSLDVVTSVGHQSMIVAKHKPLKTQATQTEITFTGKVLLPAYLTLSPRAAGYALDGAELAVESPNKMKKLMNIPSDNDCEELKESDLKLRLYSLEGTALIDQKGILDKLRRRVCEGDQKEILVNFQPRPGEMRGQTVHKILAKMPSEGNVITRQQEARVRRQLQMREQMTETQLPDEKCLGKSDSEPTLMYHERMGKDLVQDMRGKSRVPLLQDEAVPRASLSKESVKRTDSEESNQSVKKRQLFSLRDNTSSGTPSGESQYYSLTDHSSLPVSPEQFSKNGKANNREEEDARSHKGKSKHRHSSRERVHAQSGVDGLFDECKWSGSDKSGASSLEMDRTVAYSSDTEFGSVKSDDSHTLVDVLDSDGQLTPSPMRRADKVKPPVEMGLCMSKIKTKDAMTSPESETSSGHFVEIESVDFDKMVDRSVVNNKSDLSRTDSNKSSTSEDYVTANEFSEADSLKKGHRRSSATILPPPEFSDEKSTIHTFDITHLSLPRRREKLMGVGGDLSEGLIFSMKEFSVIPEVLRESVSSVATSPSIESSTSGSYTVDSGMSEIEVFTHRSSINSVFDNNNHQIPILLKQDQMEKVEDDVKRQDTASSDALSEEDSSVRSRVAKFESLQKDQHTKPQEKHRVTLEIQLETDVVRKASTSEHKSRRHHHKGDKDEPLSESSIFQKKKTSRVVIEKPEIPPKPYIKDIKYTRRSLSPDSEFCLDDKKREREQKTPIDAEQDLKCGRKDGKKDKRTTNGGMEEQATVYKRGEDAPSTLVWPQKAETEQKSLEFPPPKQTSGLIKKPRAPDPEDVVRLEKTRSAELAIEESLRRTAERRAYSESPETQWRARAERSHSFSREMYHDSRSSVSPERNSDGRPRKHDRKALEFRRTISDTTELLRLEARRRLLTRTPEREIDFSEMAKVLCTHCGERLRQSVEAEHNEALAERYLSADIRRSHDHDLSPRTSVSSGGLSMRDLTSSRRSSRDHDLSPSAAELAELAAHARYLTSSGPSSLESLLRRSPGDTPVFFEGPMMPTGSQGSLRLSVQDIAMEEDQEDFGVYAESYHSSVWIYIGDNEELTVWSPQLTLPGELEMLSGCMIYKETNQLKSQEAGLTKSEPCLLQRTESIESTGSEREFKKRYQAVTHRMVHRKSSLEMYKRLSNRTFDSDKTVVVHRKSGEFGFRIHGSRPVVVSAIEPGTPAESSGLEVGDIIISVNGNRVVDASHSEVVKIAHAGTDTLQLDVARTCHVLAPIITDPGRQKPIYTGFLYRLGGIAPKKWHLRWFVLKQDNCLYYYKAKESRDPLGAIALVNYTVSRCGDAAKQFSFKITKFGSSTHFFAAETEEDMSCWAVLMDQAATCAAQNDLWMEMTTNNLSLAATALANPNCHGYLVKLGLRWKTWRRRYCILKDGCIYIYMDANALSALGIIHLHGYRVQTCLIAGKKYAFEAVPHDPKFRHFYFHAENETDKKSWLAALEYSIDRWIKVG